MLDQVLDFPAEVHDPAVYEAVDRLSDQVAQLQDQVSQLVQVVGSISGYSEALYAVVFGTVTVVGAGFVVWLILRPLLEFMR